MKTKKERNISILFILALVMGICGGCSNKNIINNTRNTTGSAIHSEGASSKNMDIFKISPEVISYPRYHNSRCLYVTDWQSGVEQYSLDGTNKKSYKLDKSVGAIWVTENWLYYSSASRYSEKGHGDIWRMPLSKKDNGEIPDTEKKEKLVSVYNWFDFLEITDEYVAYTCNDSIFRLDLKTKKAKKISRGINFPEDSWGPPTVKDAYLNPVVKNHITFFYDENGTMYRLDLQKGIYQKENSLLAQNGTATRICAYQNCLYLGTSKKDGAIIEYDVGSKKNKTILTGKKIEQLLQKEKPWDYDGTIDDWIAYPSFVYNNRLYLSIELRWADEGFEGDVWHYADFVISCQLKDGSDLRYEQELSECMDINSKNKLVDVPEQSFYDETGYVRCCMGDYAIVTTTAYEDSQQFAWIFYNLKTDKHYKVVRGDRAQYYLYFIGETPYDESEIQ